MPKRIGRPPIEPSRKRGVIFRFVTTAAEARKIRSAARRAGLTLSEYLRNVAIPKE
jgi:mobilization protein NikA